MSISRWMVRKQWYIYTMEYYSAIKKNVWISSNEVDETRAYYTQWSKPERKTPIQYAAAKSLQSCLTLCDPIDSSTPGSPVPGILQARTLEWVAISFSNAWKWKVKVKSLSHVRLLATPWAAAFQAPLSMGFSQQEYWSGVPLPSPNHDLTFDNHQHSTFLVSYLPPHFLVGGEALKYLKSDNSIILSK